MQKGETMQIKINGQLKEVSDGLTVEKLLGELGYQQSFLAIAVNRECVRRAEYASKLLNDHDDVEILAPMAGG
jgi:sulfur carrier protein